MFLLREKSVQRLLCILSCKNSKQKQCQNDCACKYCADPFFHLYLLLILPVKADIRNPLRHLLDSFKMWCIRFTDSPHFKLLCITELPFHLLPRFHHLALILFGIFAAQNTQKSTKPEQNPEEQNTCVSENSTSDENQDLYQR